MGAIRRGRRRGGRKIGVRTDAASCELNRFISITSSARADGGSDRRCHNWTEFEIEGCMRSYVVLSLPVPWAAARSGAAQRSELCAKELRGDNTGMIRAAQASPLRRSLL